MAINVFNTSSQAKDPLLIKAGRAKISISGGSNPMLALNCTIQFGRNVEVVPTIGDKRILSVGEPQGTVSIQTVVAKDESTIEQLLGKEKDCKAFTMTLTLSGDGTCGMDGKTVTCSGCIGSAVSVELQGGRGYVASGVQITFTALDM